MKILITGVCGFVGYALAKALKERQQNFDILGIDNLSRRGSETNLSKLKEIGVKFIYGDIRNPNDFDSIEAVDFVIDCAANPSVLAGTAHKGSPAQIVDHNLKGTLNLLEYGRRHHCGFIVLSTSRVYSMTQLNALPLRETGKRFELVITDQTRAEFPGLNEKGIGELFPTTAPLSLYGATKLASEIMALEYGSMCSFPVWINRCGVMAGPGQFGKIDQGILSYWIYQYILDNALSYIGYGGKGLQVRDFLHPCDLVDLILMQMKEPLKSSKPRILNIGGGLSRSLSLAEMSDWCNDRLGRKKLISSEGTNRLFDVPYYVSDTGVAETVWRWRAKISLEEILDSTWKWAVANEETVREFL